MATKKATYMGVEYLNLVQYGMLDNDTCSGFANEPVAGRYVYRRAVQRIRMYIARYYRETRKYREACSQSTATMRKEIESPRIVRSSVQVTYL